MRYVVAAYDAPYPALAAVAVLRDAGIPSRDVALHPSPPRDEPADAAAPHDATGLDRWLADVGMPAETAFHAEAARRGAILLLVRCATLSAPVVARLLAAGAPLDPVQAARRWATDPGTRYEWDSWSQNGLDPGSETADGGFERTLDEVRHDPGDESGLPGSRTAEPSL